MRVSLVQGVLEKLLISPDVHDAATLCTQLPDCPDPPPPPPTDPPPTVSRSVTGAPVTTGPTPQLHKPTGASPAPSSIVTDGTVTPPATVMTMEPSASGSGDFDTEEPFLTESPSPSSGPCGGVQKCPFYGICMDGVCECPSCMANGVDLVCGSDMVTYGDECALRRTSCMEKREITYRKGACDGMLERCLSFHLSVLVYFVLVSMYCMANRCMYLFFWNL